MRQIYKNRVAFHWICDSSTVQTSYCSWAALECLFKGMRSRRFMEFVPENTLCKQNLDKLQVTCKYFTSNCFKTGLRFLSSFSSWQLRPFCLNYALSTESQGLLGVMYQLSQLTFLLCMSRLCQSFDLQALQTFYNLCYTQSKVSHPDPIGVSYISQ